MTGFLLTPATRRFVERQGALSATPGLAKGGVGTHQIILKPAKSKRGRQEGDGTENVINCRDVCRKLS